AHFRIILLTKGAPDVQGKRLQDSGLNRYLDGVYIVSDKSASTLRAIYSKEKLRASRVVVIGDSLRSDILPALETGAFALWIPSLTWRYEQARIPRSPRLVRICDFGILRNVAERLG